MNSAQENSFDNINTVDYWNDRFGSGDWSSKGGFSQTRQFALAQLPLLNIATSTTDSICDFGCGAGDSFPIYRDAWPSADLIGVDFSSSAIELCRQRYGSIAHFICGDVNNVPQVETVICSNVLEHLDDDQDVVSNLLTRCKVLKVIVPYNEHPLTKEHVRSYQLTSFDKFNVKNIRVFNSPGWTEESVRDCLGIVMENAKRLLVSDKFRTRRRQILFDIVAD
jgi:trans-aconitate methyltransferase